MPRISVLLPCYNAAATLREALNSLRAQTFTDFEIVVVDDGSTDDSFPLLQHWAETDSRLVLLRQAHAGIVEALNYGLQHCQAPLVARIDADDRSLPQRLALQLAYLEAHPDISIVGSRVEGFPAEDLAQGFRLYIEWLNSLQSDADICAEIFVESPLAHPSVLFRRKAVLAAGGYQEHGWAEDYDLWLRLYLAGERFACLPQVLLQWRDDPARLTRRDERYSSRNFIRLKAHYLAAGPLQERDAVILWGAGSMGKRLGSELLRLGVPLLAYADPDPKKIGRTRRGLPVFSPQEMLAFRRCWSSPLVLAAVGTRGARPRIRFTLGQLGLVEGQDWLLAA